ncbi:MAG: hypothetical protein LKM37_06525 [Bacteroidales bacterium]|jgi:hypothetical protein|nr:hypothetical protein [Bacteroidales bacterium]
MLATKPALADNYDQKDFSAKDSSKEFYKKYVTELFSKFDRASSNEERVKYGRQIYAIAKTNKDDNTQIEAIGEMASYDQDHEERYIEMSDLLPKSNAKAELLTFIKFLQASKQTDETYCKKNESAFWNELITEYKNGKNNSIYEQAGALFNISAFYTKTLSGSLDIKYIEELGKLVEKLPADGKRFLPLAYYMLTANYYVKQSGSHEQKAGVSACRQALNYLDLAEIEMRQNGRKYLSMDKNRYIIYMAMLRCNQVLSKDELSECLKKIEVIASKNKEVAAEFNSPYSLAKVRYYMSVKDYASATPYLDSILNNKNLQDEIWIQKECLENIFIAGKALGKEKELKPYLLRYIQQREQENSDNLDEKVKEIQVLHDVNGLRHKEIQKQAGVIAISTICVIALLIVTIVMLMRSKRASYRVKRSEDILIKEKESIAKANAILEHEIEVAESDNKMKALFLQKMNKEIKTPLRDITNYANMISDSSNLISADDKKNYAVKIDLAAKSLINMIETVLDVTDAETNSKKNYE